jgi:uncharacterized coiled-coil DUF342 family protein
MAKQTPKGKAGVPRQIRGLAQDSAADYNSLSQQADIWDKINKAKKEGQKYDERALKYFEEQYGSLKNLKDKADDVFKKWEKFTDKIEDSNDTIKKVLNNFDDIDDTIASIGNQIGKNNKLYDTFATQLKSTKTSMQSVSNILQNSSDLTEGQVESATNAAKSYKDMGISIANASKELQNGKITQSEFNDIVKKSYENFEELSSKIDDSTESGKALLEIFASGKAKVDAFNESAKKSAEYLDSINQTLDTFGGSGIPLAGQMSDVFKKMANKDVPGLKAGLVALGAAAGALAASYFGAPMQVAIETYYDKQQNIIDGAKELVKINNERGFIPQKIGLELSQSQIDNQNELNRLGVEREFAAQKAANQFSATMKSNTAEFQAASKTALFGNSIGSVSYAAGQLQLAGVGAEQIASSMTAAADATGRMPTAKIGSDMAVLQSRTGASAESIASINEAYMRMDGLSAGTALNMQEGLRAMSDQAKVNLGGVMEEMATASKDMLGYQIKSASALSKQVIFAKSMGVSFNDIAKAGQGMVLNYKDSIKSEMQLSAMLGKNVDLSEVRAKFASGDTSGAISALKAQGLDPANMDMFQQQMLQQATGMDLTTLSKINQNTGKSVSAVSGNVKAGNQSFLSRTQSAQQTLASQQAIISADQAIVDAKLSQKITEAYLKSPGYLAYQNSLADQQAKQAQLNTLIEEALLNSPQMQALKAQEKQLSTQRTIGENVLPTVGGIAGGLLTNKLLPKAAGAGGGLLSKAGGFLGKAGGGILGKAGGLLGKVAAPLMIAKGLYDGFQGFTADKDASTGDKFLNAGSSILSGLTFGLLGKDSDTIKAEAEARKKGSTPGTSPAPTATQVAAATPANTSVAVTDKWMQDKLTKMSGNLERVVDRTHKTMMNTAQSTKELQTLNANTKAMLTLTKTIEALTVATYTGTDKAVVLSLDGKHIAASYTKYKGNTEGTTPKK